MPNNNSSYVELTVTNSLKNKGYPLWQVSLAYSWDGITQRVHEARHLPAAQQLDMEVQVQTVCITV